MKHNNIKTKYISVVLALSTSIYLGSCGGGTAGGGSGSGGSGSGGSGSGGSGGGGSGGGGSGGGGSGGLGSGGATSADSGLSPGKNFFSFPNYGNVLADGTPVINLTAASLVGVCGGPSVCDPSNLKAPGDTTFNGKPCNLTAVAQAWMKKINISMANGHCLGMSALVVEAADGEVSLSALTNGSTSVPNAFALAIKKNPTLQGKIAAQAALQYTKTIQSKIFAPATMNAFLTSIDKSIAALKAKTSGSPDLVAIGVMQAGGTMGHAIDPLAVIAKGNGIFNVTIYDSNIPGATQTMVVDTNKNTAVYKTSLYTYNLTAGNKQSLIIVPVNYSTAAIQCPFVSSTGFASHGLASSVKQTAGTGADALQVLLFGMGNLGFTPALSSTPGATQYTLLGSGLVNDQGQEYDFPLTTNLTTTLSCSNVAVDPNTEVDFYSPGYDFSVYDITCDPGQVDTIYTPNTNNEIDYTTSSFESPDLEIDFTQGTDDFSFYTFAGLNSDTANGLKMSMINNAIGVTPCLNTKVAGQCPAQLRFQLIPTNDTSNAGSFYAVEIDDNSTDAVFRNCGDTVLPTDTVYFDYANWDQEAGTMPVEIQSGGPGGTITTMTLTDDPTCQ